MQNDHVKWRKETSFWDTLEVPAEEDGPHLFSWLDTVAPSPMEHDFVLYTDGSGCTKGWGASASIIEKVDMTSADEWRRVVDSRVLVSATYGSTVQRRELSAFLDGVHEILRIRAEDFLDQEVGDFAEVDRNRVLNNFTGPVRVSILWYTDRMNLAKSLLFDDCGGVLNARNTEADLWLRYSAMARHVCVTPMCLPRNQIPNQAACDKLCEIARKALMHVSDGLSAITSNIYPPEKWNQPQPQKALF